MLVDALRADKASASAERGQPEAVTKSPFEGAPGQIDRGGTAWALANCGDALEATCAAPRFVHSPSFWLTGFSSSDAELFELPTLLNCAVELAQETSNEQVRLTVLLASPQ